MAEPTRGERLSAVVDTSVLVPPRSRNRLIEAGTNREFYGVISPHIIGELHRVLTILTIRDKGLSREVERELSRDSKSLIDLLLLAFEVVDTTPPYSETASQLWDEDDHHLVAAAQRSGAALVISENTRDFPPKDSEGRHRIGGIEFLGVEDFFSALSAHNSPEA